MTWRILPWSVKSHFQQRSYSLDFIEAPLYSVTHAMYVRYLLFNRRVILKQIYIPSYYSTSRIVQLKDRTSRNDFFKWTFPPKNLFVTLMEPMLTNKEV